MGGLSGGNVGKESGVVRKLHHSVPTLEADPGSPESMSESKDCVTYRTVLGGAVVLRNMVATSLLHLQRTKTSQK